LTAAGWIFMIGSLGFSVGLAIWCFIRVLNTSEPEGR